MLPRRLPLATTAAAAHNAISNLPDALFVIRGGGDVAAGFDVGMAKTRLEGLAYSTVTTLMLNAALRLFSATPKSLKEVPQDGGKEARLIKFVSTILQRIALFRLLMQTQRLSTASRCVE